MEQILGRGREGKRGMHLKSIKVINPKKYCFKKKPTSEPIGIDMFTFSQILGSSISFFTFFSCWLSFFLTVLVITGTTYARGPYITLHKSRRGNTHWDNDFHRWMHSRTGQPKPLSFSMYNLIWVFRFHCVSLDLHM